MIKTFKETLTSLQDKNYGPAIIAKPFIQTLWYWSQYFIIVAVITVLLVIAGVTYFAPQLPRLLRQYLPDAYFQVKDGRFSTSLRQPALLGSSDFPIIINTAASNSAALNQTSSGILLLSDKVIFKQDINDIQTQNISDFPNFYVEKSSLISWVNQHQVRLWFIIVGLVLGLSLILSFFLWAGRLVGFAFWSLVFWLIARITKRQLTYLQTFNLVLYASVLPFLMSAFLVLAPNQILSLISLGVFLYFIITWLINLPQKAK